MLRQWQLVIFLGTALLLAVPSVMAIERTGSGALRSNTKVDVQIETINTFVKSVTERLKTDINNELGYGTDCATPSDTQCRIHFALTNLMTRVEAVEARLNALTTATAGQIRGLETDPSACAMATTAIPAGCNVTTHRMVWQLDASGGEWKCVARGSWDQP